MDFAQTDALQRIARVIAGLELSRNGHGGLGSAGERVDQTWRDHLTDAAAILNALREPDERMAQAGDPQMWTRMVRVALGEDLAPPRVEAGDGEAYQKPLG